jgi:hypothetical protein
MKNMFHTFWFTKLIEWSNKPIVSTKRQNFVFIMYFQLLWNFSWIMTSILKLIDIFPQQVLYKVQI